MRSKILRSLPDSLRPFDVATLEDVRSCYRLFFLREPDAAGLAHWTRVVESDARLDRLREEFLNSQEFRELQATRNQPHMADLGDFKIYYRPRDWVLGNGIAHTKSYEPHVAVELAKVLGPGKVFLDIGANIGYFTLSAASRIGPAGKVISFEPNPNNVELLCLSLKENGSQNLRSRVDPRNRVAH